MAFQKVENTLKFRDKGISVEEARKRMLEANEAPTGIQKETRKNAAVNPVPSAAPAPVAAPIAAVPAPVAAPVVEPVRQAEPSKDKAERIENNKFIAEIKQENGQWIASIQYKNGAGPEVFAAETKNELLRDLLVGKANGTLRVREAVRREKFGGPEIDKSYNLPDGLTQEDFAAIPKAGQDSMIESWAAQDALAFCNSHPEYYAIKENNDAMQKFLRAKGLPFTLRNFEYAYQELFDDELTPRPAAPVAINAPAADSSVTPQTPNVPAVAPTVVDSTSVTVEPPAAPAAVVSAAPAPQVRKRGTTGLQPGFSSSGTSELETQESGKQPSEPSEAELRNLPLPELQRLARKSYKPRQF